MDLNIFSNYWKYLLLRENIYIALVLKKPKITQSSLSWTVTRVRLNLKKLVTSKILGRRWIRVNREIIIPEIIVVGKACRGKWKHFRAAHVTSLTSSHTINLHLYLGSVSFQPQPRNCNSYIQTNKNTLPCHIFIFSLVTVSHGKNPNFFNTIVKSSKKKKIWQQFNIVFLRKETDYTDKVNNILPLSFCIVFPQIKRCWPKSGGKGPWVKCPLCRNENLNSDS